MPAPTMAKSNSCMGFTLHARRRACNSWTAMNIAHLLLGAAQEFRDVTALARGAAAYLGYRDLWRKVSVMSTLLRARFGLSRGDRGAINMTNCVKSLEVMYANWHAGLSAVPMNAKLHAKEFAFI